MCVIQLHSMSMEKNIHYNYFLTLCNRNQQAFNMFAVSRGYIYIYLIFEFTSYIRFRKMWNQRKRSLSKFFQNQIAKIDRNFFGKKFFWFKHRKLKGGNYISLIHFKNTLFDLTWCWLGILYSSDKIRALETFNNHLALSCTYIVHFTSFLMLEK